MKQNEFAEECVSILRQSVHTERQLLEKTHELHAKVLSLGYLLVTLADGEKTEIFQALHIIVAKLTNFIEDEQITNLHFSKEGQMALNHLQEDVAHRDWVAALHHEEGEEENERHRIAIERAHLETLHKWLLLMKVVLERKEILQDEKYLTTDKRHPSNEIHYYISIYKFCSAYMEIFSNLIQKEKILEKKLGKDVRSMERLN